MAWELSRATHKVQLLGSGAQRPAGSRGRALVGVPGAKPPEIFAFCG